MTERLPEIVLGSVFHVALLACFLAIADDRNRYLTPNGKYWITVSGASLFLAAWIITVMVFPLMTPTLFDAVRSISCSACAFGLGIRAVRFSGVESLVAGYFVLFASLLILGLVAIGTILDYVDHRAKESSLIDETACLNKTAPIAKMPLGSCW